MSDHVNVPGIRPGGYIWGEQVQEVQPGQPIPSKTRVRTTAGWYTFPNDRRVPIGGL